MTDLKGSQGPMESKHIPEMKAYQHLKHLAYIDIHTFHIKIVFYKIDY